MKAPCITRPGTEPGAGPRPPEKTYFGWRTPDGRCRVMVSGPSRRKRPLRPRLDLRNHSPTGFEWGYGGSGPAQLTLALLADACGDTATALRHYQESKREVVTVFGAAWTLTARDIQRFVECREEEE